MSRASLVEIYISSLPVVEVAVVSDGRRCRITEGEPAPGEKIKRQFYFKSLHAELVLATIDMEGLSDQQPGAVAALIEQAAETSGRRSRRRTNSGKRRGAAGRGDHRAG
jgi:hypothetical protein